MGNKKQNQDNTGFSLIILAVILIGLFVAMAYVSYNHGFESGRYSELSWINENYNCYEKVNTTEGDLNISDNISQSNNNSFDSSLLLMNTNISSSLEISQTNEWIAYFSPDWKKITINKEVCYEVTCECAKNTDTPCLSICYYCEEDF